MLSIICVDTKKTPAGRRPLSE